MSEETEEGFTVRDRRRFLKEPGETPSADAPADTPSATPSSVPSGEASSPVSPIFTPGESQGMGFESARNPGLEDWDTAAQASPDSYPHSPEEMTLPDIYSVLLEFLGFMRSHAWLRMGLVANPSTGEVEKDLAQAKVAIDTAGFIVSQLEPVVAPEERLPLRALVSDLQIAFVEQNKRDSGASPGPTGGFVPRRRDR